MAENALSLVQFIDRLIRDMATLQQNLYTARDGAEKQSVTILELQARVKEFEPPVPPP